MRLYQLQGALDAGNTYALNDDNGSTRLFKTNGAYHVTWTNEQYVRDTATENWQDLLDHCDFSDDNWLEEVECACGNTMLLDKEDEQTLCDACIEEYWHNRARLAEEQA